MNKPLILCGVSGGADSICMLHLLWSRGDRVAAAHFNHGMRGADAERDEAFVRQFCAQRSIPFYVGRGNVYQEAESTGEGVEVCGRRLRYEFFDRVAREIGAELIATAHNADDQSETVLMRLLRGSGSLGLSGIPAARSNIIRPILHMGRVEIEDYLRRNGLDYIYDSTNSDDRYVRNLLRHRVMPILKEINPNLNETMARCAWLSAQDEAFLKNLAADFLKTQGDACEVNASALSALAFPVASRVLRLMADRAGLSLNQAQVLSALELASGDCPSAVIHIRGGAVWRRYERLVIGVPVRGSIPGETPLAAPGVTRVPGTNICIVCNFVQKVDKIKNSFNTFYLNSSIIDRNITVRSRTAGDIIKLPGRRSRSLKKLMCDLKLPAAGRDLIPIIAVDGAVAVVMGIGADASFLPREGQSALELRFCETTEQGDAYDQ